MDEIESAPPRWRVVRGLLWTIVILFGLLFLIELGFDSGILTFPPI